MTKARKRALQNLNYQRAKNKAGKVGYGQKQQTILIGGNVYSVDEVLTPNFAKGKTTQQLKSANRQLKDITSFKNKGKNKLARRLRNEMISHIRGHLNKSVTGNITMFIRNVDDETIVNYYNVVGSSPAYVTALFDSDLYFEVTEDTSLLNTYLSQNLTPFPDIQSTERYRKDVQNYNKYIEKYNINAKKMSTKLPKTKAEKQRILKKMGRVKI